MMIEIDDDVADNIVKQSLLFHYIHLTNDIKNDKKIHPEDLEIYKQVSEAIKVLGNWYWVHGEFDKEVKKAKKKL